MSPGTRAPVAGDGLLHPLALVALMTWAVNDHVLKAQWPGVVSGKLSDVAGLFVFPLVLQALVEVGGGAVRRPVLASRRVLAATILATAVVFAFVQISPLAGDLYRVVWGWLSWPLQGGFPTAPPTRVALVQDPTDLIALPVLAWTWTLGQRRASSPDGRLDAKQAA